MNANNDKSHSIFRCRRCDEPGTSSVYAVRKEWPSPDVDILVDAFQGCLPTSHDPVLLPRNAGSWPGYVFTSDPLRLPAGHFGLGHGSGAHAPDEYYVLDSANPKVQGIDGAARSYVEYLHAMGAMG